MFRNTTRAQRLAIVFFLLLLVAIVATLMAWEFLLGPRAAFRRLVLHPIPASVRNIKTDRCQLSTRADRLYRGRDEHAYVLRFDVSEEDLSRIIAGHGLEIESWQHMECYKGEISWPPWRIKLYRAPDPNDDKDYLYPGCPRRSWFDLDSWFDLANWEGEPRLRVAVDYRLANGYEELTLLCYNEHLAGAFFIKWESSEF
jgi:hypothetical protein